MNIDGLESWAARFDSSSSVNTLERVLRARDEAAKQAVKNMARYKFDRFGYYAARWVTLNKLLPKPYRCPRGEQPFFDFVALARVMSQRQVDNIYPKLEENNEQHD